MIIEALNFSSLFIAQGERIFLFGLGGGKSHSFQKKQRRISDRQQYKVREGGTIENRLPIDCQ